MSSRLERFVTAQENTYESALAELHAGQKQTHWMWFIFPQIQGLGHSETARFYAIENLAVAKIYLFHPTLGHRLRECAQALLQTEGLRALDILGSPDDLKLKSSMTLFEKVAGEGDTIFTDILDRFYDGERCLLTLQQLETE
tara:strand:- start:622 stop:1047 length:426 start_codon:yes stop_codon:yes gene_type:complete